ncbi:MAG: hypothetical protein AB9907_07880 [Flexilinea sp.]
MLWQKDDLSGIQHDSGYAYYARIPNENAAKLDLPLFLIEDNVLINPPVLAVNQDLPRDIKETGKGLYELLPNNNIFFSSTDETDPTTGKHTYAVLTPTIIRVRYLLPVIAIPSLIFIILCFIWLTAKIRKDKPALINIKACAKDSAKALSIFILILLMIPWKDFFNPPVIAVKNLQWVMPLIQRNIVYFLILAVCLLFLFRMKQSNKIMYGLMGCILVLNTGYYFMPEKDYYGVRTDSASYISAYDAHSIRTPGYPRFIEDVMTLSPNSDLDYWRSDTGQKELSTLEELLFRDHSGDSRGLVQVVRAQKVFLGISFLLTAFLLCFFISPYFVFLFGEFVLVFDFLGVYNNYIMSEVISQAFLLLSCGIFCYLIAGKNKWVFPFLGLFCAISVLVRPSNIFIFLLILIAAVILFVRERKGAFAPVITGLIVSFYLIQIPASVIYREYHQLIWIPNEGYASIGHSLALMDEEDITLQEDEEARKFLKDCYERIGQMKAEKSTLTQNDYVFGIALEETKVLGYDAVTANKLFDRVSATILPAHFSELREVFKSQLLLGIERTRIRTDRLPYLLLSGIFVFLSIIRCSRYSMTGLLMILLHNLHLLISITNQPERRYIWSTEIIFLMGAFLILYNLFRFRKPAPVHRGKRSEIPG